MTAPGTIVKIQMPLGGNVLSQALIYNQDHSLEFFWPVEDLVQVMAGRAKVFFLAFYDRQSKRLAIERELPDQGW